MTEFKELLKALGIAENDPVSVRGQTDAAVVILHAIMISHGFRSVDHVDNQETTIAARISSLSLVSFCWN